MKYLSPFHAVLVQFYVQNRLQQSNRISTNKVQHLSYDGCLEVRGKIIRTVVLYCVLKLCIVISALR